MTKRLVILGCLTAYSIFLQGLWPLASAQDNSSIPVDADDPVETRYERLETELKAFLAAKSESVEQLTLSLIEEGEPTVEEIRLALGRAMRSEQAADLKPGISHEHVFEVAGLQLSASLFVPTSLKTPSAMWVIPAHPLHEVNKDEHFEFILGGLQKDTLVLWVHLIDAVAAKPDSPVGKKYGRGVPLDLQKRIDHGDVFEAAVAMALRRFPVDPDRVYCMGVSASGIATWWNGLCLPDVFAGICCCDTNPIQLIPWMGSLRPMRVGILHGEKDDRCPVEVVRRADKELLRLGVERRFVEIAGGRHGVTWRRHAPQLCAWVAEHTRDPHPQKVTYFPVRSGDRCFWMETLGLDIAEPGKRSAWEPPPAKIEADVRDDGTINITTRGVTRLRVWLDDDAALIRVNKIDVKTEPLKRLRKALVYAKARRDPQLFWAWAVDVEVAANDN
jgi:poly(3-hydroxybutyrate) depolymerase